MKQLTLFLISVLLFSCGPMEESKPTASSGVQKASVSIQTGVDGLTVEQRNIKERYLEDNKPGSIKHLYIMSAYSGQVIMYSTVKGKVTSSGKRLSPTLFAVSGGDYHINYNPDLIQDDGTYGSSVDYVYWWDSKGIYHQRWQYETVAL